MNWINWIKNSHASSAILLAGALFGLPANATLAPDGTTATAADYEAAPPQVVQGADPFLLINLSVELTQQAESFTGANQTYTGGTVCPGRDSTGRDVCYTGAEEYIGYFDPNKCYVYVETSSTDNTVITQRPDGPYGPNGASGFDAYYFKPDGATDNQHRCNNSPGVTNQFSGNFLNWSTMTALDQFRAAMTGGARIYDSDTTSTANPYRTLLARAYRYDTWGYVDKRIERGGITVGGTTFTNDPKRLTPWDVDTLVVDNDWSTASPSGHRTRFYQVTGGMGGTWTRLTTGTSIDSRVFNVIVEVCDPTAGLESNCVAYSDGLTTWYKPEGLLQKNALKMRYALTSYSGIDGNGINGGVLRSNAKYIGEFAPTTSGGYVVNGAAEIDSKGLYVQDPEGVANGTTIVNSGILNYINMFALATGRYKSNDPAAEIYYEGLRYIMGLDPTPSFSSSVNTYQEMDGFPVYNQASSAAGTFSWIDPITTANACQANYALYVGDQFAHEDNYLPGSPTASPPVTSCTTECADFQFYPATTPPATPSLTLMQADTWTNTVGSLEGLGNIGNSTRSGRNDGFWIAGLAYWANMNDVRPTIPGNQSVTTFVVDTQEYYATVPLRQANQLWLAAKYGGFDDLNGDGDPNDGAANKDTANAEWTSDPSTNPTPDPDAYTLASQPDNLVLGLTNVFNKVLQSSSSASAAAVVSNSAQGIGALYEAIYEPRFSNNGVVATWSGLVRGLFIDDQGRVREDSNGNRRLDTTDYVVKYVKNNNTGTVTVDLEDTAGNPIAGKSGISVRDISPVWNARNVLANMTNAQVTTDRNWPSTANSVSTPHALAETGRYIFTWIDGNVSGTPDGTVDSGEVISFNETTMSTYGTGTLDTARLLGLDSTSSVNVPQLAQDLVNYIRGEDKPALSWRNRTVDIDSHLASGDAAPEVLRLGDIVHSAPLVVGPPEKTYDTTYSDYTYRTFKQAYANRRQVVYVGANDGMLHAFNAGFFDPANKEFDLTGSNSEAQHALGSELWAYVPYNLLPHLQWLKDPAYPHIYYVDGSPQAFDVNIFTPSATHPEGWGTILVVGFRLGGGDVKVDPDSDHDGTNEVTMRSAFVVLDITDPEQPPTLLAEITDSRLGFTTAKPTVVKRRVANAGSYVGLTNSEDQWYLVMGSGPAGTTASAKTSALTAGVSDQQPRIYFFNLNTMQMDAQSPYVMSGPPTSFPNEPNSFIGGLTAIDWDRNYSDEVIYFGTVGTTTSGSPPTTVPTGSLFRLGMTSDFTFSALATDTPTITDMFSASGQANQPFTAPPYATRDIYGQPWVYAGSGRFLVSPDILLSAQMSYYGLKETPSSGSVNMTARTSKSTQLEDTTGVQVFTNATITPSGTITSTTFSGLLQEVRLAKGWFFDFSSTYARHVDRTLQVLQSIIFTDYVTTGNSCAPLGSSNLYAINMLTGTSSPYAPLGTDPNNTLLVNNSVSLGTGEAYLSGVQTVNGTPMVRYSTSLTENEGQNINLPTTTGSRMSWREIPVK